MKITLVFPGQGTQYVGMGSKFNQSHFFNKANETLGYDLKSLMLQGPSEILKLTQNTQPAVVTHSLILFHKLSEILQQKKINIQSVLGHSVGEYAALCAARALTFEDAVRAVHFRGKFMQEAVPQGQGAMFAVLKQSEDLIVKACKEASNATEKVSPANFNEPQQIVISGDKNACQRALSIMEETTQKRVKAIELQVSAPFHCELMKPAEEKLKVVLDEIDITPLQISYIANVDAKNYDINTKPEMIKNNLLKQVCGSVLWTQSIRKLSDDTLIIECGPGKILAGLIKKINPNLKIISLDTEAGFSEIEAL